MRIAFVGDSLTEGRPGSSYVAILREKLPGHTLVSLHRRLSRLRWGQPFDIAFLWVGVNDVVGGSQWTFEAVNALLRKPRAKSRDEFRARYRATLELLLRNAQRVIAVSLLLKGEDAGNPWNRELEGLSNMIEELTSHCDRAGYLDVRQAFIQKLAGQRLSDYLPKSVIQVAFDALTLRDTERINRRAAERGLYFTLDGIHLNGVGAEMVAEIFLKTITGAAA